MSVLHELLNALPTAEIFQNQIVSQPCLELHHWFFTATCLETGDGLLCYLSLNLNLSGREMEVYKQARAMGLLAYHFYHRLSDSFPQPDGVIMSAHEHAGLGSHLLLQTKTAEEMILSLNWLQAHTTEFMQRALQFLAEIASTYDLGN